MNHQLAVAAPIAAVVGVAEAAVTSGNVAVADKARLQISRLPDPTDRLLQLRKAEIMTSPVVIR